MAPTNLFTLLRNAQSRSLFILSLLVLALPTGYDVFVNPLLLVVLINTLISARGHDWLKALKNPVFWLPALFYGYYASSVLWAENTTEAWPQLETKLTLLLAPLVLAANARFLRKEDYQRFLKYFVAGNLLTLIFAFGFAVFRAVGAGSMYFMPEHSEQKLSFFTYTMLAEPIMHVGYFSTYVGIGILICMYFIITKTTRILLWYVVGLLLVLGFVMLQGRINILALFAVIGLATFILAVKQRLYKLLALPVGGVVFFMLFVVFGPKSMTQRFTQLPNFEYDISAPASAFNSATYRLAEWKGAALVIAENPFFGTGVGDNRLALHEAYKTLNFHVGVERHFNAHNQYVETTIASGLVGLALLLLLLAGYIFLAVKHKNYLLIAAIGYFALSMLTESMLERAWAVILYAVFFPLFLIKPSNGAIKSKA